MSRNLLNSMLSESVKYFSFLMSSFDTIRFLVSSLMEGLGFIVDCDLTKSETSPQVSCFDIVKVRLKKYKGEVFGVDAGGFAAPAATCC